jgi:hypothetical protein
VEKTRAAHSIFEVFKTYMYSPIKKTTATQNYCDLILNNNFGTRQADNIFHCFIDIDQKYGSEIVYKSIHKSVANTITSTFERIYDFSDRHDADFETIISMLKNSLLHFRSEMCEQLVEYYKLNCKNRPVNEGDITTEPYIILINPIKSHEISDSIHNLIFNWDLQPKSSLKKNYRKSLIDKIEDDYSLMYQFCFEDEDCNTRANWDDLLSAYARYILYNHSKFHSINIANTDYIASTYSDIYAKHLEDALPKRVAK